MRYTYTLLAFLLLGQFGFSQNNLTVFAEDGEKFILHINGEQINSTAASRVEKKSITEGMAALRIVFADDIAPDLKKSISFLEKNTEVTAKITMTNKGYKLKYFGEEPINDVAEEEHFYIEEPANVQVVEEALTHPRQTTGTSATGATTTTVETTTMTSGDQGSLSGESVEMNVGINGFNMNVDVTIDDNWESEQEVATSTTTTTTTTTVTSSDGATDFEVEDDVYVEPVTIDANCYAPLGDVSKIRSAIAAEAFADERLMIAKQSLKNACVRVSGVIELAELFDFEDDRLEFVKYCYERTFDTNNFYQVNSVFDFSDSKEELNKFLEGK